LQIVVPMSHGGHSHDGGGHSQDGGGHSCSSGHAHGGNALEKPLLGHAHDSPETHSSGHGQGHAEHGDGHGCCSGHAHGQEEPASASDQQRLKTAVYCAVFFMLVEIVGGVFANSLAIITDAAHMLSDVGGFIVSLVALQLSARGASGQYTYGYKQAEVLGALLSVAIVWALTAILLWEAVPRFQQPENIDAPVMFTISVVGFIVNLILMKVLGHGHSHGDDGHGHGHGGGDEEDSVAVQAALAHVIGDIVQSLGVCLAAVLIWVGPSTWDIGETCSGERSLDDDLADWKLLHCVSNWNYADPLCTALFGVIVLLTTKSTFVRTIDTLMGKAPKKIDQFKLLQGLEKIPNVVSVHDLHVWPFGSSDVLCTAHVVVSSGQHSTAALNAAIKVALDAGIGHSTFQVEISGEFDPTCESRSCYQAEKMPKETIADGHGHSAHAHDDGHSHA